MDVRLSWGEWPWGSYDALTFDPYPPAVPRPAGAFGAWTGPAHCLRTGPLWPAGGLPPTARPAVVTGRCRLGGSAARVSRRPTPTRRPVEPWSVESRWCARLCRALKLLMRRPPVLWYGTKVVA